VFSVEGLGFRVKGLGLRIWDLEFRATDSGISKFQGLGYRA
jgi:hypothetical protein